VHLRRKTAQQAYMHLPLLAIFIGWIPVSLYLFYRYPARVAVLANFSAGWAILPGARYVPATVDFPYWILGVCLPTNYYLTKATVTGLAGLAGFLIFHFSDLKRFRPGLCDIPMAIWCCVPLLSAATHWNTLHESLFGATYQTLAWGVPWLLGRIYFSDYDSLLLAAKACVIAGVCYIPICLVELITGPQLYAFLYGYQPYRFVGAERYIGFRPVGLLEDGNQLGIWMAAATLVAVFLSVRRLATHILGLPLKWIAAALALTTLLCQSAGSILLLLFLLPLTLVKRPSVLRALVAVLVVVMAASALFLLAGHSSLRALAQHNRMLHFLAAGLERTGRHSLLWRMARDAGHISLAFQKPFLGTGHWSWWQNGDARPWSLWLLVFGMYGIVGLAALVSMLFPPLYRTIRPSSADRSPHYFYLRLALVGLILMVALDSLLNSAIILPYLLILAGMSSPDARAKGSPEAFPESLRAIPIPRNPRR
jgi:hypothetical protein